MGQSLDGGETLGQEGRDLTGIIGQESSEIREKMTVKARAIVSSADPKVLATCLKYLEHYGNDRQGIPPTQTLIEARCLSREIRRYQQ